MRLVLDTDVIIAALRSQAGASAAILTDALDGNATLLVSVALALEYEAVATRDELLAATGMSHGDALRRVSTIIALCEPVYAAYRWRPQLRDPDDEMVLEAAVNGGAELLVTFNLRDFGTAPQAFGIDLCRPADALRRIRS